MSWSKGLCPIVIFRSFKAAKANIKARDGCRVDLDCSGAITGSITDESKLYYSGTNDMTVSAHDDSQTIRY